MLKAFHIRTYTHTFNKHFSLFKSLHTSVQCICHQQEINMWKCAFFRSIDQFIPCCIANCHFCHFVLRSQVFQVFLIKMFFTKPHIYTRTNIIIKHMHKKGKRKNRLHTSSKGNIFKKFYFDRDLQKYNAIITGSLTPPKISLI